MGIEQGRYAVIRLGDLLQAATVGWLLCASNKMKVDVRIFGTDRSAIMALMGAMEKTLQVVTIAKAQAMSMGPTEEMEATEATAVTVVAVATFWSFIKILKA